MKNPESIEMTRVIDAPRNRVFEAWTRAEHLGKWYAPKGFTITDCAADARPGGVFRMRWRAPWGGTLEDEQRASSLDEVIYVNFEQTGSRTKRLLNSTARGSGAGAAGMLAGLQKGWTQTVDRLGVLLEPRDQKEM